MIVPDFLREYHIDLYKEFDAMSWSRFVTLLGGLSAESNWIRLTLYEHNKPFSFEEYDATKETREQYNERVFAAFLDYKESHPEQQTQQSGTKNPLTVT